MPYSQWLQWLMPLQPCSIVIVCTRTECWLQSSTEAHTRLRWRETMTPNARQQRRPMMEMRLPNAPVLTISCTIAPPPCDRVAHRYRCPSRRKTFSVLVLYDTVHCTVMETWTGIDNAKDFRHFSRKSHFLIPVEGFSHDTPFNIGLGEKAKNSVPAASAPDSFTQMRKLVDCI